MLRVLIVSSLVVIIIYNCKGEVLKQTRANAAVLSISYSERDSSEKQETSLDDGSHERE
jgi:hypothetical protein